jgi:hypothetical protein
MVDDEELGQKLRTALAKEHVWRQRQGLAP